MAKGYNPFSIFRKNQKVALALITLLSMFAFVCVGPSMFGRSNNPTPGAGPAAVLAKWDYGDITRSDVSNRLTWRIRINRFLNDLHNRAAALGKIDPDSRAPAFQPENESGILETMVLAKKAELLGMSVSDRSINEFIDAVTGGPLSAPEKEAALGKAAGENRAGSAGVLSDQLFDSLRFELLARNFVQLLTSDAIDYNTPEERWDYFSRLNRQATVEALGVAVKDFVDKVPNPDTDELQALYDKYKDRLPQPEFPEPGFMAPARGTFQYFKAVRATLSKADESKITDKEIDDYYAKHKENFRKSTLDESALPTPSGGKPKSAEKPKTEEKPATGQKPATEEKPKTGEPPKPKEKSNAETPKSEPKPKESKPAAENPPAPKSETKPAAPAPTESKSTDKKPADNKPATDKSSDAPPRSRSADEELLALADTPAPPSAAATEKKPDAEKPAPAKTEPAKIPAPTTPVKSEPEKPAPGKPEPAKPEPAKTEPAKTEPGKSAPAKTEPAKTEPGKTAPAKAGTTSTSDEFDPVTDPKVRATIRTTLANQKAAGEISDAFKKLRSHVQNYGRAVSVWIGNSKEGEEPEAPDFKALAKGYGLSFEATGSISAEEAQDTTELGKSMQVNEMNFSVSRFAQQAFDPNLASYMPQESMAPDGEVSYLWWRTDFKPAYVPAFDDAKPDVLHAWKMIQARKLAMEQAKKYADDANKRQAKLKEIFLNRPNMTVSEIGPFHWLTIGNVPMGSSTEHVITLTRLTGLEMAGQEFMHAVFTTAVGKTTAAFNQPQTIAYVVQVQTISPPEDVFRMEFQNNEIQMATRQQSTAEYAAAQRTGQAVAEQQIRAIEKDVGFQLLVTPAQLSERGSGGTSQAPMDEGD